MTKLNKITWEKLFTTNNYKYKKFHIIIQNNYVTIRDLKTETYKTTFIIRYDTIKNIKGRIKAECNNN